MSPSRTLPPDPDDDARRALDAIRRVVAALRSSSRAAVRDVGVTGAQLFVLQQIGAAPGVSVGELAERTLTRQNTVSEVVGRLVRRGLVRREAAADDARRTLLTLTRRGHAVLVRAPGTVQARLAAALRQLSGTQRRALADGLERWLAAAGLAELPPAMFFERGAAGGRTRDRGPTRGRRDR